MRNPARANVPFLLTHPAHFIALGCGSGLAPFAPGTFGTLFGWLTFTLMAPYLTAYGWSVVIAVSLVIGIWACHRTGRDLGALDHPAMVWDEIVAIWLVLVLAPRGFAWQVAAVLIFRFFDIVKPSPIREFDRAWKGGVGVMWDDLIAAFYSLLVIALAVRLIRV